MTNEERDIITSLIERVSGAPGTGFGSAAGGAAPALPPIDKEADALIAELFAKYPEARYRLTQTAFVQEHALAEAQNRIQRLEAALQQAQQAAQSQPKSGGFLSGLFGGGGGSAPRPQQPQAQPAWNQGAPAGSTRTICRATSAVRAGLSAGDVPAVGFRVPRLGADHGGRSRRRVGGRQRAHEPVFAASGCRG